MTNWLPRHGRVLQFALRRLAATPINSLFNILVIGIALSLPTGLYVLLQNVQGLLNEFSGTPQISVFLSLTSTPGDSAQTGEQLRNLASVSRIEFIPRNDALEQLKRSTELSDVIGGLNQNPLPDAYIVFPKKADVASLESLRDQLKVWPNVDHVQLDSAWARKLEALLHFGELAALILATLLSIALTAITFNTIRLQILTQKEEIEIAKLIGATHAFIRRPFIYYGLLQGLLGGLAAWIIIAASLTVLNTGVRDLAELYSSSFTLHHLAIRDSISLLLFSAYLGWLGAWLSVTQHLRHIEPR
ncbi:MAG: ABC transporter permease [Nitrosomonadales bacterium]|nr:ABC transporter permease [Nitrosomonadales bacterium]